MNLHRCLSCNVVTTCLPTLYTPMTIQWDEHTSAAIGSVGEVQSGRL